MDEFNDYIGKECPVPLGYDITLRGSNLNYRDVLECYTFINNIIKVSEDRYDIIFDINQAAYYKDILMADDLYNGITYVNNSLEDDYIGFISDCAQAKISVTKNVLINLLTNVRKDIVDKRKELLWERNITRLVHFTKMQNIDGILENGILSRATLASKGYDFSYSDGRRLDNHIEYINTSLTFPNYRLLYKTRNVEPCVVFGIDSGILLDKLDSLFLKGNASSNVSQEYFYKLRGFLSNNYALEEMFKEKNRSGLIPDSFATDPQAEVLIKDCVDLKYINACYYDYLSDYKLDELKEKCKDKKIHLIQRSSLFAPRIDYKDWS